MKNQNPRIRPHDLLIERHMNTRLGHITTKIDEK